MELKDNSKVHPRKFDCVHIHRQNKVREKRCQGPYHFVALVLKSKRHPFFRNWTIFARAGLWKPFSVQWYISVMLYELFSSMIYKTVSKSVFNRLTDGYARVLHFPTCQRDRKAPPKDQDICQGFLIVKYVEQLRIWKIIFPPTPDVKTLSGVANRQRRSIEFCENSVQLWNFSKF